MFPISDLTTLVRPTRGQIPPQTAGASTTLHGDKVYLFGGRLVSQRRMLADMYVFDIKSLTWEKIGTPSSEEGAGGAGETVGPQPRYFHSADVWEDYLVVFGGMTDAPDSSSSQTNGGNTPPLPQASQAPGQGGEMPNVTVLSDIHLFHLPTRRWLPPTPPPVTENPAHVPLPRYAHLSAVSGDRLYVIGGHGPPKNDWLDNVHVYDLRHRMWVGAQESGTHAGTYRSVAVCAPLRVVYPPPGSVDPELMDGFGPRGRQASGGKGAGAGGKGGWGGTDKSTIQHLSYSEPPPRDEPNGIYIYSNYNFMDVSRELILLRPTPSPTAPSPLAVSDETDSFASSPSLPPGLRFPTGAILGNHLLLCGTYLAHTYNAFSLWSLDLRTHTWQRIDPGSALSSGSWSRGLLYPQQAKFLIFGNRSGNLVEDYQRRLLSWTHVAIIDLEAWGIYQPPSLALGLRESELGLAALEAEVLADFEIVCDDGRLIRVSRRILDERWPWFREQRRAFLKRVSALLEDHPEWVDTSSAPPLEPPSPRSLSPPPEAYSNPSNPSPQGPGLSGGPPLPRPDPRLTPRKLLMPEPYPLALALVQYLYTYSLMTPLQRAPPVLGALLVLSQIYEVPHLQGLVRHALHERLSGVMYTAPPGSADPRRNSEGGEGGAVVGGAGAGMGGGNGLAVSIYEMATVVNVQSLQIRALKVVMGKSNIRGPRIRPDKHEPTADPPGPPGGPPGPSGGGEGDHPEKAPPRPRGMSNARELQGAPGGASPPAGGSGNGAGEVNGNTAQMGSGSGMPGIPEVNEAPQQAPVEPSQTTPTTTTTTPPPRPPRSARRLTPPETPTRNSPTSLISPRPRLSSLSMEDLRQRPQGLGVIEPPPPSHTHERNPSTTSTSNSNSGSGSALRRAKSEVSRHRPTGSAGSAASGTSSFKSALLERRFTTSARRPTSGTSSRSGSSSSSSLWGAPGSSYVSSQAQMMPPSRFSLDEEDDEIALSSLHQQHQQPQESNPRSLRVKVDLGSWLSLGSRSRSSPGKTTPREEQQLNFMPPTPALTPALANPAASSSPASPNPPLTPSTSSNSLFGRSKSSKSPFSSQRKVLDAVRRQTSQEENKLRKQQSTDRVERGAIKEIIRSAETKAARRGERELQFQAPVFGLL